MEEFKPKINPTHLSFRNSKTPFSEVYDDIYFDSNEGVAESDYVYLEGTKFVERIKNSANHFGENFVVGEVGFGVGLNFLLTFKTFLENASPKQHLTYISAEKNPVFKEDLTELYSRYPELLPYAQELLKHYPLLTPGFHWIKFPHHPVSLLLMLGDAADLFSKLDASVDFWFWDGFSPAKNPDAFSEKIFEEVDRLSAPNATGASFTVAGWVRRSLEQAGFTVTKRQGFGKKRECIVAVRTKGSIKKKIFKPWFSNENVVQAVPGKDKIGIIGAGLAGTAVAQSLSKRGFEVHVVDQYGVAERASGNDVALYNVQLSKIPNAISRFSQLSLSHFLRELSDSTLPHRDGLLRMDEDVQECMKTSEYPPYFYEPLTAEQASEKAEVRIDRSGVYFPECGVINPHSLCIKRIQGCSLHLHQTVQKIVKNESNFSLINEKGNLIVEVDHLVYASGADSPFLNELAEYPLRAVRGQTIQVSPTDDSRSLQVTLVDQGYIAPIVSQISNNPNHLIGATYQAKEIHLDQIERDAVSLVHEAKSKWYCFKDLTPQHIASFREGFRFSSPDKLPLIGPHCSFDWIKETYQKYLKGANPRDSLLVEGLKVHPREWLLIGLGSRGVTYSSYGAEILANLMCGEAFPVEADLWEHLHPARFFIRKLMRTHVD